MPSKPVLKHIAPLIATGGVLVALGATALPMLSVWRAPETPSAPVAYMGAARDPIPEVVVQLYPSANVENVDRQYGIDLKPNSIEAKDDHVYVAQVTFDTEESLLSRLKADSRVEVAEPEMQVQIPEDGQLLRGYPGQEARTAADNAGNCENNYSAYDDLLRVSHLTQDSPMGAPNDPRYPEQWNFRMVGAEDAWKRSTGKGVIVAVIDTGVAIAPSAKGKPCKDFNTTQFVEGYNFVDKNTDAYDDHAHGTHVSGTIAESTNNGEGVAGLAYGATIMPIKVLSATGSGTSANVADGIRYAADHGAKVINMSLGSAQSSGVIHEACKYARGKGVTIVCAAGNSFGRAVGYPAAYPECIAVSSVGPTGKIAKYSSYGKQVALAAPGGDMVDSQNPADGILQNTNYPEAQGGRGDDYYAFQGTSMACPHVAAVAALIEAQGVTDPARVRDILTKSATPNGEPNKYGAGILSAAKATELASHTSAIKLRHFLLVGLGALMLVVGGTRRRAGLRVAMAGALAIGMFGPDWFADKVGADSAWNLITFSAAIPLLLFVALHRGPGVKVAGVLALGVGLNLFANWHNDTLPFTAATFGDTPLPWTFANLGAALAIGGCAAARAYRATRHQS